MFGKLVLKKLCLGEKSVYIISHSVVQTLTLKTSVFVTYFKRVAESKQRDSGKAITGIFLVSEVANTWILLSQHRVRNPGPFIVYPITSVKSL